MKLFITIVAAFMLAAAIMVGAFEIWYAKKQRDERAKLAEAKVEFDKIKTELEATTTSPPPH